MRRAQAAASTGQAVQSKVEVGRHLPPSARRKCTRQPTSTKLQARSGEALSNHPTLSTALADTGAETECDGDCILARRGRGPGSRSTRRRSTIVDQGRAVTRPACLFCGCTNKKDRGQPMSQQRPGGLSHAPPSRLGRRAPDSALLFLTQNLHCWNLSVTSRFHLLGTQAKDSC